LLRIPTLTDEKKLAVMMTLQILFLNAYNARPSLAVLISCRIIDITLKHGACAVSSVGFGGYGVVISRYV
jgi:histidine kinase